MRRRVGPLTLAVLVLLGVGLGSLVGRQLRAGGRVAAPAVGSPVAPTSPASVVAGLPAGLRLGVTYLSDGPGLVDVLLLARRGDRVLGTARAVQVVGRPPAESTSTTAQPVAVTRGRHGVGLSFSGGPAEAVLDDGHGAVSVAFPEPDGTSQPVELRPADPAAVAAAATALDREVTRADAAAEQAAAAGRAEAAVVSADLVGVTEDRSLLAGAVSSVEALTTQAASFLGRTESAARQVDAEVAGAGHEACLDGPALAADAAAVAAAATAVTSASRAVDVDAASLSSAVADLRQALARLVAGSGATRTGPGTSFSPAGVVATATAAAGAASSAERTDTADRAAVGRDVELAYTEVDADFTAAGCADPPTPPAP